MQDVHEVRRGKWPTDESSALNSLPSNIKNLCAELRDGGDDWAISKGVDGQMWLVSKHWDDPQHYTIVASVIKYESEEYSLE